MDTALRNTACPYLKQKKKISISHTHGNYYTHKF